MKDNMKKMSYFTTISSKQAIHLDSIDNVELYWHDITIFLIVDWNYKQKIDTART